VRKTDKNSYQRTQQLTSVWRKALNHCMIKMNSNHALTGIS